MTNVILRCGVCGGSLLPDDYEPRALTCILCARTTPVAVALEARRSPPLRRVATRRLR